MIRRWLIILYFIRNGIFFNYKAVLCSKQELTTKEGMSQDLQQYYSNMRYSAVVSYAYIYWEDVSK